MQKEWYIPLGIACLISHLKTMLPSPMMVQKKKNNISTNKNLYIVACVKHEHIVYNIDVSTDFLVHYTKRSCVKAQQCLVLWFTEPTEVHVDYVSYKYLFGTPCPPYSLYSPK